MDFLPKNLTVSKEDLALAEKIIAANENIIIRYLRKTRTVFYDKIYHKLVICAGVPTGVMVAIKIDDVMRIGWSRRLDEKALIDTNDLHTMFRSIVANVQGINVRPNKNDEQAQSMYDSHFRAFCDTIIQTLSAPVKDVEIEFSKKAGKKAAVLRAMLDDIFVHRRFMQSAHSGPIPNEVMRGLKWFVPQAEEAFSQKADNFMPYAEFA